MLFISLYVKLSFQILYFITQCQRRVFSRLFLKNNFKVQQLRKVVKLPIENKIRLCCSTMLQFYNLFDYELQKTMKLHVLINLNMKRIYSSQMIPFIILHVKSCRIWSSCNCITCKTATKSRARKLFSWNQFIYIRLNRLTTKLLIGCSSTMSQNNDMSGQAKLNKQIYGTCLDQKGREHSKGVKMSLLKIQNPNRISFRWSNGSISVFLWLDVLWDENRKITIMVLKVDFRDKGAKHLF
jgi:hypothetical protein